MLGIMPADPGCAIFEVDDEPQLKTRVRHRDVDVVPLSNVKGLRKVGMNIDVEHAPDLVVGAAFRTPLIFGLLTLPISSLLYKL